MLLRKSWSGWWVGLVVVAAAVGFWIWTRQRPLPPLPPKLPVTPPASRGVSPDASDRTRRLGGLDVTFVVFSDTHFGYGSSERDLLGGRRDPVTQPQGTDVVNARAIAAMNALPGQPWPKALGGPIGTPRGVLVSGDLTEDGKDWQWHHFAAYYGLSGQDALLRYPVFEGHGNHDKQREWYVLNRIRERHGDLFYAFDWNDLHVVCLGEAPDRAGLTWLAQDLDKIGKERPIVLYLHFPLQGPFAEDQWFGRGDYRERLAEIISGYQVIGVFHGHYHASGRYRWRDWDVYNVGAAKHGQHSFAVVHVSDERLRVASYQFSQRAWQWWHDKPILGSQGAVIEGGSHAYSRPGP